jgi:tripartite-type tricarboxylate transporter receptor subunit TctC
VYIINCSVRLALGSTIIACASAAFAQDKPGDYPSRPIRIIIGVPPGAGAETVARMTAEILSDKWGQNVVIDSRPGGGGVIASTYAARAEPDGYTLYQNGFGILLQGATKRVPFDPLEAFVPVARKTQQPYIMLVQPGNAAKSVKDLIGLSKSKPLTYAGSSGVGSTVHIGMEKLAKVSGIRLKHIAYKGGAASNLAVMGGEIDISGASALSAVAAVKSGKARALVNLGAERIKAFPDLPTLAEEGYPQVEIANMYNLWAPAGTPAPIIEALNTVVPQGLNSPKYRQKLEVLGSAPVKPMSVQQVKAGIERDYAELKQSVKELGIKF